ncbi:MAG: class I SAM-dependent methyltransferase [Pseudanabaena sp. CAN_BIN31]|nr:class I SAM-dependent methyltransferase [Pseudanabaena sp. CAN_BIN31]
MTTREIAKIVSSFPFFDKARELWLKNQQKFHLPLSKTDKLIIGIYLIIKDYSEGLFPPTFDDQKQAYEAEVNYRFSIPGLSVENFIDGEMRKPFLFGKNARHYLENFFFFVATLEELDIYPNQRLLELGCGLGWMSELLATMGFDIIGSSISSHDIEDCKNRIKSLEVKRIKVNLDYLITPMESVSEIIESRGLFDVIFVFEALHHAHDWRKAITSSYACLKDGGWLIICNEPNVIHTYVSYRVAKLSNTHEVGFKRSELFSHLKNTNFSKIKILKNQIDYWIRPHWIAAQK